MNADGESSVGVEGVDDGSRAAADSSVGSDLCLHFGFIEGANSILSSLFDEIPIIAGLVLEAYVQHILNYI